MNRKLKLYKTLNITILLEYAGTRDIIHVRGFTRTLELLI